MVSPALPVTVVTVLPALPPDRASHRGASLRDGAPGRLAALLDDGAHGSGGDGHLDWGLGRDRDGHAAAGATAAGCSAAARRTPTRPAGAATRRSRHRRLWRWNRVAEGCPRPVGTPNATHPSPRAHPHASNEAARAGVAPPNTTRRRRSTREPATGEPLSCSAAGEPWPAIFGQPRKATTALAITNRTAAQASTEPAVPKPAMYARVTRIVQTRRPRARYRKHARWPTGNLSARLRRPLSLVPTSEARWPHPAHLDVTEACRPGCF